MTLEREGEATVFDIKWIRESPDAFDAGLTKRGLAPVEKPKSATSRLRRS